MLRLLNRGDQNSADWQKTFFGSWTGSTCLCVILRYLLIVHEKRLIIPPSNGMVLLNWLPKFPRGEIPIPSYRVLEISRWLYALCLSSWSLGLPWTPLSLVSSSVFAMYYTISEKKIVEWRNELLERGNCKEMGEASHKVKVFEKAPSHLH